MKANKSNYISIGNINSFNLNPRSSHVNSQIAWVNIDDINGKNIRDGRLRLKALKQIKYKGKLPVRYFF